MFGAHDALTGAAPVICIFLFFLLIPVLRDRTFAASRSQYALHLQRRDQAHQPRRGQTAALDQLLRTVHRPPRPARTIVCSFSSSPSGRANAGFSGAGAAVSGTGAGFAGVRRLGRGAHASAPSARRAGGSRHEMRPRRRAAGSLYSRTSALGLVQQGGLAPARSARCTLWTAARPSHRGPRKRRGPGRARDAR